MFLLNEYKKSKIIVAHVNYNLRKSSNRDQKIVEDFCNKNNIELRTLVIKKKPVGNLENWAREIRYKFFKEIYSEKECTRLMTGHHRDDFLETAIMQQESNRVPEFFGIKRKREIDGMNIVRPFINIYWKKEILADLEKAGVEFGVDETNKDLKLTRNRIRDDISKWPMKKKKSYVSWFRMSNRILKKKNKRVNSAYIKWEKSGFSVKSFRSIYKYKVDIVFKYVHAKHGNVKLSSDKLKSIVAFIEAPEGNKKFKLNDKKTILKKDGVLS